MLVTESETIFYVDVDETLIFECDKKHKDGFKAIYYKETKWVRSHKKHIDFVKSLKDRGYYVIVHSGNGWKWAKEIICKLNLQDYVHEVKSKPIKHLDDKPSNEWMGQRVYIDEN
jgi:hydroxymethylpyrimidine pyrophosphatase-like HAD family hydrolase